MPFVATTQPDRARAFYGEALGLALLADGFPQDARGAMTFGDSARVAWFRDPDGNFLSLTQAA